MNVIFLILATIAFGIAAFAETRWANSPVHFGWVGAFILALGALVAAAS